MDKVKRLLNSIYLGDRFCEGIDIKDRQIRLQINCISRVRDGSGEWNYYSDEDIEHGCLVFDEVVDFGWDNGLCINDEIYDIELVKKDGEVYSFIIHGCNVSDDAVSVDTDLRIKAKKFYILNPKDKRIIEA